MMLRGEAKMHRTIPYTAVLLLFAAAGCGSGRTIGGMTAVVPPTGVDFNTQIQPIFDNNCALSGCHASGSASGGMVLDAGQSYANLVNVTSSEVAPAKRVAPGNSAASYIIKKLTLTSPGFGERMPLGGDPLPDDEINLIRTWIDEGAKP
jgi:hypothetical protein